MARTVALKGVLTAAVVLLVLAGAGGYLLLGGFDRPTVESVDTRLETVTADTTTVNSTVVVRNPNDRALPDVAVRYGLRMNDVEMGTGRASGVRLAPGRTEVTFTADVDNGRVSEWWVRHVDRDESTTLTTTASASVAGLPFSVSLPPRHRQLDTDVLDALTSDRARTVTVGNASILQVGERRGRWGEVDPDRTPIRIRTSLANRHDRPVGVDEVAYTVRMNDVVVGTGTDDGFTLRPGERRPVTVDAHLDPSRMEEWWVSHLRRGQTTTLNVTVDGHVDRGGERRTVPLAGFGSRAVLETDLFGNGTTTVTRHPTPAAPSVEPPCVHNRTSRWGEPTAAVTPVLTTIHGCNPNDGALADVLRIDVSRTTTVGGEAVASNRTFAPLPTGPFALEVRSTMRNDEVPAWWAAHLERGERSSVHTTVEAAADIGITTIPLEVADREGRLETDFLADLRADTPQTVSVAGRPALTVVWTRADWANATAARAPIRVRMRVHNDRSVETTLADLNYTVSLGDTRLADRASPDAWTFAPGETRTIETTLVLDNARMADWWPGHVRRGERSELTVAAYATVASGERSERTRLDVLGSQRTVRTDLLDAGNATTA